jgi:hypothetical protein
MASVRERLPLSEIPATTASLTFFDKTTDGAKRAFWVKGPMSGEPEVQRTNMCYKVINKIPIYDLRAKLQQLSLDHDGFQLAHHPSAFARLQNDTESNELYMDETAQLVKRVTSAEHVIGYDLRVGYAVRQHAAPGINSFSIERMYHLKCGRN